MSGKTTLPSEAVPESTLPLDADVTLLVIAWYPEEPNRIGEMALPPPAPERHVLGRGVGEDDDEPRLRFFRQRPGSVVPTPPLEAPALSRRQLLLGERAGAIELESVGRAFVRVNGREVERASVRPGDVLSIERELILLCVRRAPTIPPLRHFPRQAMGEFGKADALGIIGESPAAWRLREAIAYAAKGPTHALVFGETGSGKELAARGIHRLSPRRDRPFVARNAATLPAGIIDAELFGNLRNYPNPGMPERAGLIGEADGGTLFLDEVGELGAELQAHLLRVLDSNGEYQRLGETRERRADICFVCATNRRPESLKHDFMSRLAARVEVPSLAARREDVPLILAALAERAAPGRTLSPSFVTHTLLSPLPGNVRELERLLFEALGDSDAGEIKPPKGRRVERPPPSRRPSVAPPGRVDPTEEEVRAELARMKGNVTRAARALGLSSRYALYRLMQRYGIEAAK